MSPTHDLCDTTTITQGCRFHYSDISFRKNIYSNFTFTVPNLFLKIFIILCEKLYYLLKETTRAANLHT